MNLEKQFQKSVTDRGVLTLKDLKSLPKEKYYYLYSRFLENIINKTK